ncbi:hypothetical protein [Caulobacter sp. 17J65-9]|uniref:hypothetical protein n=1 Tax=Caulobacter sp. 17J65-9 TaxID=2709382 RepID=UPI0013C97B78|nr:hypothetical protein [Caulobacter sp. 17J65-9]NEX92112.1 hypothetical protein [Caulobacter sp. 17J65-9]
MKMQTRRNRSGAVCAAALFACMCAPASAQEREDAWQAQIQQTSGAWAPFKWESIPTPEAVKGLYGQIGHWSATFECVIEPTLALGECAVASADPPGVPAEVLRASHERSAALRALLPSFRAPPQLTDGGLTAGRLVKVLVFATPDGLPRLKQPSFGPISATKKSDRLQ